MNDLKDKKREREEKNKASIKGQNIKTPPFFIHTCTPDAQEPSEEK